MSTTTGEQAAIELPSSSRVRHAARVHPFHLAAVIAAVVAIFHSVKPIEDVDSYWHVLIGREILDRHTLNGLGDWSFAHANPDWLTSQWLSEVLFSWTHDAAGFAGLTALRTALAVVIVTALAAVLLRGPGSPRVRAVIYCISVIPLVPVLQARPQTISFAFLVWLAHQTRLALRDDHRPRLVEVAAVTWVWANFHALWVLVPALFGLVAVAKALEAPRSAASTLRRGAAAPLVAIAAGACTPAGPRLLGAVLQVTNAARDFVMEWQTPVLASPFTWGLALLVLVAVVTWSRSPGKVPRREIAFVLTLFALGMTANRNVLVAAVLMAPVVTDRAAAHWDPRPRVVPPREARMVAAVVALTMALGALVVAARFATTPALPDDRGIALAKELAKQPGSQRILNDYNLGGVLLTWRAPDSKVAVDGRADYYGAHYLHSYFDLMSLKPGWQRTLTKLSPNYAVLERSEPLVEALESRGWQRLQVSGDYVLLTRAVRNSAPSASP